MPDYRFTGDISEVIVSGVNVVAEPVVPPARLSAGRRRGPIPPGDFAEPEPADRPSEPQPEREPIDPTDRYREESTPRILAKALGRYMPPPATSRMSIRGKNMQRDIRRLQDDVLAATIGYWMTGGAGGTAGTNFILDMFPRTSVAIRTEGDRIAARQYFRRVDRWIAEDGLNPDLEPGKPKLSRELLKRYPRLQNALKNVQGKVLPIGLTLMTTAVITNEVNRNIFQKRYNQPAPGPSAWDVISQLP